MFNVLLIGSTGFTGNAILAELVANPNVESITTLSRSPSRIKSPKIKAICLPLEKWFTEPNMACFKLHDVAITAFGTTRKAVNNDLKQWRKVDYGTNYDFAKAAKYSGVPEFILVSSMGASASSRFLYMKTKGELEEDIQKLGFKHCFVLRPGALMGHRIKSNDKGFGDRVMRKIGNSWPLAKVLDSTDVGAIGKFSNGLIDKSGSKTYSANDIIGQKY